MRKESRIGLLALALLVSLGLVISTTAFAQATAAAQAAAKPSEEKKSEEKKSEEKKADAAKPGEEKSFDDTVKDMEVVKGLFTFYRKADENKILMEILPDQLENMFLFAASVDQSVGERGLYASQMGGDFPFFFRRVGKNVQWVMKNTSFTAAGGTPAARATARSFPNAILAVAKIQSKPHPERKSILVDVSDLFVSDLPAFAIILNQAYRPTNYRFDKNASAVAGVKAFPENVLLEVWLHYTTENPQTPSVTLPDVRSIPIAVKYELSTLKETGYQPRLADDRVGHFLTIQQDFTSDRPSSPYVRYITRWQLEKADPSAKLSPPKQPIVFWLENTIPVEYREPLKQGVLLWNKAFERIGIKDAIVVKQMPDDADWDPADTRYNTIRWFAGVDATFAIGPSRANPFTGQIYDADIGFSEGIVRFTRRSAEEFVAPVVQEGQETAAVLARVGGLAPAWSRNQRFFCDYADGLAQQAAFGVSVLDERGMLTPEVEEKLMREFLIEVTAHEVGHTLGLRHNFRASTILKLNELNDIAKTDELSQSSSVMDYNPIVIAPKGEKQGHFAPPTLGPYDYWAIEYAYKPIEGKEKEELAKIASRVADPLLPYSTDEDAIGTYSPRSIDPLANQFDQSSDPIAYFRQRIGIVNELWASEESKLAKPGEGYQVLRRALVRGIGEYNRGLLTSSKFIGGIYHYRDHVGDPSGRVPFTPVPAAKQREALDFLRTYAFSDKAFQLPPGLQDRLAIERLPDLDFLRYYSTPRLDFPWHDTVLSLQRAVLNRLYHPITLARIQDNELRFAANEKPFTMADMFKGLDSAIWSELDSGATKVSSLRRNLQREHLKQLIRLALRPAPPAPPTTLSPFSLPEPPTPRPPEDATTLARASLVEIQAKIRKVLAAGAVTDTTTRAHLQETQGRIASTLQAQVEKPLE